MPTEDFETLYHYTSVNSLLGIVQNREIWLTDYRFLNDTTEFLYLIRAYKAALEQIDVSYWLTRLQDNPDRQNAFSSGFSLLKERGWFGPNFDVPPGYGGFVFSLSECGDSLSQWRAYGNGEICIGFRRSALEAPGASSQQRLGKVRYVDERKLETEVAELNSLFEAWVNGAPHLFFSDRPIFYNTFIKHDGFAEEKEWRLVKLLAAPEHNDAQLLRANRGKVISYIKIAVNPEDAICSLVIGPNASAETLKGIDKLTHRSPLSFLKGNAISHSRVPYVSI